jgi:hypothetical protein
MEGIKGPDDSLAAATDRLFALFCLTAARAGIFRELRHDNAAAAGGE